MEIPEIKWAAPWRSIPPGQGVGLAHELRREAGPQHRLFGVEAVAVARRIDCDDVLFVLPPPHPPLAVVHLTWAQHPEQDPAWPGTFLYRSWDDWVARCLMPDQEDYGPVEDDEDAEE